MKKVIKKSKEKKALPKMKSYLKKDMLFAKYPDLVIGFKKEKFSEPEIIKILNDINKMFIG